MSEREVSPRGRFRGRVLRNLVALVVLSLFLGACGGGSTMQIGTILDDPSRFDGEDVRIRGEVTGSMSAPFVGGAYRIDDGTGTLSVVSDRGAPSEGAEVEVEGVFRSVFTLGGRTLSVLEESDRSFP